MFFIFMESVVVSFSVSTPVVGPWQSTPEGFRIRAESSSSRLAMKSSYMLLSSGVSVGVSEVSEASMSGS